ncbi:hypothetical protein CLAFUW4_10510 [Fulvia fulva]|nr:hypothetical protein CLAFUR4_10513 [Fulvia fulva]KAK4615865.1 hypothetical protein CLAFUR4_10514 [Fulvia fulva]KAK4615866.1 hypothetical protein CLAFUR4_10515 [Fulvia fulva]KAK4617107.1 hypothetical protein CLAFUR0_10515 [Fulvia fulva]KAK4617108.1 hypothetical protein CLAFUR0_10516 [Fulvia fulva]
MQCLMISGGAVAETAGSPPKQQSWFTEGWRSGVHLRRPCYDFYFL